MLHFTEIAFIYLRVSILVYLCHLLPGYLLLLVLVVELPMAPAGASQELSSFSCPLHFSSFRAPLCGRYQSGFVGFVAMIETDYCFHIIYLAWYLVALFFGHVRIIPSFLQGR